MLNNRVMAWSLIALRARQKQKKTHHRCFDIYLCSLIGFTKRPSVGPKRPSIRLNTLRFTPQELKIEP